MPQNSSKKTYTVDDLIKEVNPEALLSYPTMKDFMDGDASEYFSEISRALALIREYRDGQRVYEPALVAEDMSVLSAIHSGIAEMVGYLQGRSSAAESTRKMMKSRYALKLKHKKYEHEAQGETVRLTQDDVDHASRTMAEDAYEAARDNETVSRMITAAWHAIGKHIQVLNAVLRRSEKESMLPVQ